MQVESPGRRGRGIKRALGVHGGTHLGVEHRKVSAGCLAMVLWCRGRTVPIACTSWAQFCPLLPSFPGLCLQGACYVSHSLSSR